MKTTAALFAAAVSCTLFTATTLSAQTTDAPAAKSRWGFLVNSGTLVPTGVEHDVIQRASLSAAQLTYVVRPTLAITSTVGWARSRDIAIGGDPKLDVFTYDLGAELRGAGWSAGDKVTFTPFAGAGAGGRTYDYRKLDLAATHNLAGYGSVGGELGVRRVHVRLEARDYVTEFKALNGVGPSKTGNDVVVMVGLRFAAR